MNRLLVTGCHPWITENTIPVMLRINSIAETYRFRKLVDAIEENTFTTNALMFTNFYRVQTRSSPNIPNDRHQPKTRGFCPNLPKGTEFHVILEATDGGGPS